MKSKRFEVLAKRPINQDGLIGEWPEEGLIAMQSPNDPKSSIKIENGVVVELDSKKREEGNDRKNYCTPRPLNCGSRFSIKASTASQKSCVLAQSHMASASRKARCGRLAYTVWSRFCLMRLTA